MRAVFPFLKSCVYIYTFLQGSFVAATTEPENRILTRKKEGGRIRSSSKKRHQQCRREERDRDQRGRVSGRPSSRAVGFGGGASKLKGKHVQHAKKKGLTG